MNDEHCEAVDPENLFPQISLSSSSPTPSSPPPPPPPPPAVKVTVNAPHGIWMKKSIV